MTKAVVERAPRAELAHELGYERGDPAVGSGNSRKAAPKSVQTANGPVRIVNIHVVDSVPGV
jgi:putative transposase